jgi:hypothetical protein
LKDPDTTLSTVRYFGHDLPMEFALCLRMRQKNIQSVHLGGKEIGFDIFEDRCSSFVHIPLRMDKAGILELTLKHPAS